MNTERPDDEATPGAEAAPGAEATPGTDAAPGAGETPEAERASGAEATASGRPDGAEAAGAGASEEAEAAGAPEGHATTAGPGALMGPDVTAAAESGVRAGASEESAVGGPGQAPSDAAESADGTVDEPSPIPSPASARSSDAREDTPPAAETQDAGHGEPDGPDGHASGDEADANGADDAHRETGTCRGIGAGRGAHADGRTAADHETAPDDELGADRRAGAVSVDRGAAGGGSGEVVAVGSDGARPRRSPLVVVSVAAAVLLVGGGGAYLAAKGTGTGGGSATPGALGTPPPLALDGPGEVTVNGIAPGEPHPYGVTYVAGGELPDGPRSAPVYRSSGKVAEADVARLAKVLGVEGRPLSEGGSWRVGNADDGSGPVLRVDAGAPGAWTFSRFAPGTDNCRRADVCASGTADGGEAVSEAVARRAAAPVLKALGQDDAKLDARQVMGAVRVVNADPEVGGLPTYGWTTGLRVGSEGKLVGGSGMLMAPVKSDTYPVVGAAEALDLVNGSGEPSDGRGGIAGCAEPVPLKETDTSPCGRATGVPGKERVTVEDAVFGLAVHSVDGRQALVPSWLFEVRPGGAGDAYTVTQPAVEPRYLALPEASSVEPSPEPSGPADEPSAGRVSQDVRVQGWTGEGRKLTVSFWGGVCSEYTASVSETAGRVQVTVTSTSEKGRACIMIAKAMELTVTLDESVGDRTVVGSDGQTITKGTLADLVPEGAR